MTLQKNHRNEGAIIISAASEERKNGKKNGRTVTAGGVNMHPRVLDNTEKEDGKYWIGMG